MRREDRDRVGEWENFLMQGAVQLPRQGHAVLRAEQVRPCTAADNQRAATEQRGGLPRLRHEVRHVLGRVARGRERLDAHVREIHGLAVREAHVFEAKARRRA